ncbi:MAG: hypothetical protein E5Y73_09690 [Mesorhizobium sp.]|uniref:hypothetical protein n=1 Tax=Mesorhizobium sp. TaxID=1871066 RepID=UPI00120ABC06|nr:hypothetical protein [Mesorhizobium sp.]TIL94797.1 MAG: hypothetical protein E5Y73_09690 [Mesorhizobium sp.]
MRDIYNNIDVDQAIIPAVYAATTAGAVVDLLGYNSAALVINSGAIAGAGLYVVSLEESDASGSGFAAVAAGDMQGTLPASLAADSVVKVGYLGHKRYLKATITKTSGTSIAAGAVIVKGNAAKKPVA